MNEQTGAFDDIDETPATSRQPEPLVTILVHFAEPVDKVAFEEAVGQRVPITGSMWFPKPPEVTM